ncbi:MAG: CinA family protein [Pseudomonadales bacterium]|nr:CinA family protein [Pseudomonadales bacterium]
MSLDLVRESVAKLLKEKGETVAVAESSTGGLISANLLAVPGASAYYSGGAVIYTRESRKIFLNLPMEKLSGLKPLTEQIAMVFAETIRDDLKATWGIAELGVAGPGTTPYSKEVGISVIAIAGPVSDSTTVTTGGDNSEENMHEFVRGTFALFESILRR